MLGEEKGDCQRTQSTSHSRLRVVFWGTYDLSKPRNRIVRKALELADVEVIECHRNVWVDIEDKSQVSGVGQKLRLLYRWVLSYPSLIARYLRLPRHDAVLIGYMGQLDILVIWLFARLRRIPIVWDMLMSLYVAVVIDRRLFAPDSLPGRVLFCWEWLAARAADRIILSNPYSAIFFQQQFSVNMRIMSSVLIGTEIDAFPRRPIKRSLDSEHNPIKVLFYGTLLPSHGVEIIVSAARLMENEQVHWTIVGTGQLERKIRKMLSDYPLMNLDWLPWIPYEKLFEKIHEADVCLGIFDEGERGSHALPNKIFQIIATGTPIITRDSSAIREILTPEMPGVYLVKAGDPNDLADAVRRFSQERDQLAQQELFETVRLEFGPEALGKKLRKEFECAAVNFRYQH